MPDGIVAVVYLLFSEHATPHSETMDSVATRETGTDSAAIVP